MSETVFFRLLTEDDKAVALASAVAALHENTAPTNTFAVDPASFAQIPGAPFAYWVSEKLRGIFSRMLPFENDVRMVRQGGVTGDDAKYLRAFWEISPESRCRQNIAWVPFAKGGHFAPYWRDLSILVHWDFTRGTFFGYTGLKHRPSEKPSSADLYFRCGLTWPLRASRFAPFTLPEGSIFSIRGYSILAPADKLPSLLGLGNSSVFDFLFKMMLGRFGFPEFVVGVLQKLPVPDLSGKEATKLGQLALLCVVLKRSLGTAHETHHVFQLPALLQVEGQILEKRVVAWAARVAETEQRLAAHQREIDDIAFKLYGIEGEDRAAIEASLNGGAAEVASEAEGQDEDEQSSDEATVTLDPRPLTADLLSYAVGCVFGRWDVQFATGAQTFPELPDPFAPLPVYAPGAITPETNLADYPLTIDADGILVDDPDHNDDIVRRVREVLEVLWGRAADTIEQEACSLLGVGDLRDYFRRSFFDAHIKRYSKSRRKAPIYWLLQSPKKSYGIWLYYHKLDGDMLFKALVNYIEPKLRLETDRLNALRLRRTEFGTSSKEARQAQREIEKQEAIVNDVQEFRDRLDRAAKLYLTPDLNDGVVLTIAPLHELVPWKEAKTYWNELKAGKYEWSSIGKQLREKRLV